MKLFSHICLLAFSLILILPACYAQEITSVDSLKDQLELLTEPTEKAETLLAIAAEFNREPDSSLFYSEKAFSAARQSNDSLLLFRIGTRAMYYHSYFDHSSQIIDIGEALLPYEKHVRDTALRLSFLNTLGGLGYSATGETQKQLDLLEYALNMVYQSPTYIQSATILLNNLVSGYFSIGRSKVAEVWVEKVKQAAERFQDSVAYSNTLLMQGKIAFANHDGKLGLAYFQESNQLASGRKDTAQMIESLYYIGQAYMDYGQFDSATGYLHQALELQAAIEDEANLMFLEFLLGKAYCEAGSYQTSLSHLEVSQAYFYQAGNKTRLVDIQAVLGQTLVGIGDSKAGIDLLLSSADSARDLGYQYGLEKVFRGLSNSYEILGDWKNASACKDTLLTLKALEFRTDQDELNRQIDIQEENQQKQAENVRLTLRNFDLKEKSRKRTFFIILILMVSVIIGFINLALRNKWKFEQRQNAELDRQVTIQTAHLSESIKQLTVANEDLRKFTFLASHNFLTSIRTIKSMADLIKKKYESDTPDTLSYLGYIQKAGSNMKNTLDALSTYISLRESTLTVSNTDLAKVCRKVTQFVHSQYPEKEAKISYSGLMEVTGSEKELSLMFKYLIDNAFLYHPEGHVLKLAITGKVLGTLVELQISDNGLGIPQKYQAAIFESFNRIHLADVYEGVGMGLTIVQRILKRHGGTIRLESRQGEGSTFIIQLPYSSDSPHL